MGQVKVEIIEVRRVSDDSEMSMPSQLILEEGVPPVECLVARAGKQPD